MFGVRFKCRVRVSFRLGVGAGAVVVFGLWFELE